MNTQPNHPHDDRIDPRYESLLDLALAPEPAPPGLADRIVAATTPHLYRGRRDAVIARIRPALFAAAAAVACAVGAALYVGSLQQPAAAPLGHPVATADPAPAAAPGLPIETPRETFLDSQITMLALQVELVNSRDLWSSPSQTIEDATLAAELETFTDPVMFF